jgi:hypothetical protein
MNKEDIIRKAEEDEWIEITQFVKLAVLTEREACAKVCDDLWKDNYTAYACAEAIRARGKHD